MGENKDIILVRAEKMLMNLKYYERMSVKIFIQNMECFYSSNYDNTEIYFQEVWELFNANGQFEEINGLLEKIKNNITEEHVKEGLKDAAEGRVSYIGSFAKYIDDEDEK